MLSAVIVGHVKAITVNVSLLEQHDRERRLRDELAIGVEQIERGETVRWTSELLQKLKEQSVAAAAAGKPMSDAVIP